MNLEQKLQAPFDSSEIEWRIGRSGKKGDKIWATALAYVSNRAIMNRLDEVFGCMNWQNEYKEWHNDSQLCGIKVFDGEDWATKWDGADGTQFESTKGGLSDSMKRAAVQWGIGRYLYKLDETFVETSSSKQKDWNYQSKNDKKQIPAFYWKNPELPKWALPNKVESAVKEKLGGKEITSGSALNNQTRNFKLELKGVKNRKELGDYYEMLMPKEKEEALPYLAERKAELSK